MTSVNQPSTAADAFFEHCADLACVVASDGAIARVSASAARLGYGPGEMVGRPFLQLVHPDDAAATGEALAKGTPTLSFAHRFRCKDGGYRLLSWHGARDAAGALHATARDEEVVEAARQTSQLLDAIIENIPRRCRSRASTARARSC
jgi:PAS domain S-box-containing protein